MKKYLIAALLLVPKFAFAHTATPSDPHLIIVSTGGAVERGGRNWGDMINENFQIISSTLAGANSSISVLQSTIANLNVVRKVIAGTNITISPTNGQGDVTINGGAGGSSSVPIPLPNGATQYGTFLDIAASTATTNTRLDNVAVSTGNIRNSTQTWTAPQTWRSTGTFESPVSMNVASTTWLIVTEATTTFRGNQYVWQSTPPVTTGVLKYDAGKVFVGLDGGGSGGGSNTVPLPLPSGATQYGGITDTNTFTQPQSWTASTNSITGTVFIGSATISNTITAPGASLGQSTFSYITMGTSWTVGQNSLTFQATSFANGVLKIEGNKIFSGLDTAGTGSGGSSFFDGNSFAGGISTGPALEMKNFGINVASSINTTGGIVVVNSTSSGNKGLFQINADSYTSNLTQPIFVISTAPSHGGTVIEVNASSIVTRARLFLPVQAANSLPALSFIGNPTLGLYFTGANFAFKGTAIDIFTIGAAGAATLAAGQMNISNGGTAAAPGVNLGGTQTGIFKPDGSTMSVVVAGSLATVKAKFADDGITIGNASSPFNTATLTISTNCSGNACQPIVVISSHNWGNPWRVAEITKDSMTVNVPMFQSSLTVTGSATFGLTISTPSKFPSGIDVGTVLLSSGDPIGFSTTVYANGTAYSLTATMATLDFGTKDPIVTLEKAGTYFVYAQATLRYNGATYAANQTATIKLVRTNNTAADLDNASQFATLRIVTTITDSVGILPIAPIIYTTAVGGDTLAIQGSVSAAPAAGSVDVTSATIVCIRLR